MNGAIYNAIVSGDAGVMVTLSAADLQKVICGMVHNERKRIDDAIASHRELPTLTRKEVQKILGVSETTLIAWAKDEYLVPVKIGRKAMYRPTDVDEILLKKQKSM